MLGQKILTRCSGGMEVQHKMTSRRGNWVSAILVSVRRSYSKQYHPLTTLSHCLALAMFFVVARWDVSSRYIWESASSQQLYAKDGHVTLATEKVRSENSHVS